MSTTIATIKDVLNRKFKGASIDDVRGISDYSVFKEAANNVLSKIDPIETVRRYERNIYKDVLSYSIMDDLKGKKIIDIRPQVRRNSGYNVRQTYTEDIDRDRADLTFSVEFDDGTKFLRIVDKSTSNSVGVDETDKDEWTAGTGVSNIDEDTILYSEGSRSLRFDVSSGTSYLEWTGTAVDLSTHQEKSSLFRYIYIPDSSIVTSVTLRIGSDSSNYWEITGQIHFGEVRTGWNLYRFDWNGATQTGTVDETSINYERMTFVTTSADTDIRIGKLFSRLPYPRDIVYYSRNIFKDTSGTFLEVPTNDDNVILLENDAENIFVYECCQIISSDMQDEQQMQKFNAVLHGDGNEVGLYSQYKTDKPSEAIKSQTSYYKIYNNRLGR